MSITSAGSKLLSALYNKLLSEKTKSNSEKIILYVAISSFVLHLIVIFLVDSGFIQVSGNSNLLYNPIAAIYTPFSFILIYEVYLLIYYLPKSITTYIGKQYEIITLIIIRRLFKDMANLEITSDWFQIKDDLQFTYDITASVILFFLIFLFYKLGRSGSSPSTDSVPAEIKKFINLKKIIAVFLVPVLLFLAIYSFSEWISESYMGRNDFTTPTKNINNIFFDQFFTVLILVDVILLLFSFFHTDKFHKVIRNSGFIISTILIRLSFGVEGLVNIILIISAVLFGIIILSIHNGFENKLFTDNESDKPLKI